MSTQTPLTPLRKLREARGVSQLELATAIGLDQPTISKMENRGGIYFKKEDVQAICQYFGSAITELHIMFPERYQDYAILPEHVSVPESATQSEM